MTRNDICSISEIYEAAPRASCGLKEELTMSGPWPCPPGAPKLEGDGCKTKLGPPGSLEIVLELCAGCGSPGIGGLTGWGEKHGKLHKRLMFMLNLFRRQLVQWDRWKDRALGEHFEEESRVHEWKRVGKRKTGSG